MLSHAIANVDRTCYQIKCGVCADMEFFGIKIDEALNATIKGKLTKISTPDSKVEVWVVPTNEELVIASNTENIVKNLAK